MLAKKPPHQLASSPARLGGAVVERLWMRCLQQVVELGTIRVRQANQTARRVHPGRAGEVSVGALLAKVLLSLSAWLLTEALSLNGSREVNHGLSLMTRLAQHRANDPSSATRRTGRNDCNRDAPAGFAAAHG